MRSLSDTLNESSFDKKFYAIKFISGRYKNRYLGGDGAGYTATDEFGYGGNNGMVIRYDDIDAAREALGNFNDWAKGNWGNAVIVEITFTETVVK